MELSVCLVTCVKNHSRNLEFTSYGYTVNICFGPTPPRPAPVVRAIKPWLHAYLFVRSYYFTRLFY